MRRAIATAAAAAALLPAGSAGAQCTPSVAWHTTRYKAVATRAHVPVDRRLGLGAIIGCSITRGTAPGQVRRVSVYAVRGVRPQVAIALRPSKPALYVSAVRATAAERRVLDRLRAH
jgi:Family of unknown function (DUF6281)